MKLGLFYQANITNKITFIKMAKIIKIEYPFTGVKGAERVEE
jgi:hypothetical protein